MKNAPLLSLLSVNNDEEMETMMMMKKLGIRVKI